MKIIWFSEIKWSYLKTRKQHILSNFSNSDEILFIEPVSFNLKNKFNISIEKNINYVTIPQIQNSDIKLLNYLIHWFPFKFLLKFLSKIFIKRILKKTDFKPDIIITSNIFWIDYIKELKSKNNLKIIYDCNDNPLAFPNALNRNSYFNKTLNFSDYIVTPFKSYQNFIPENYRNKIQIISNGVDSKLLLKSNVKKIIEIENINKKPIAMYIGSIDTRIDYQLIQYLLKELQYINFIFIGDMKRQIKSTFKDILNNHSNIFHFDSIPYESMAGYLSYANVCMIPFENNFLSNCILPNKVFEYSILEKPFVMTNFNRELKDLHSKFLIAEDKSEFKKMINNQISNPYPTNQLKKFAENYNWSKISKQYQNMLFSILKK